MIDARELRIGNWVKYTTGEEGQVISITEYGAAITLDREYMGSDEYDPIPLNPEILDKCDGFRRYSEKEILYDNWGDTLPWQIQYYKNIDGIWQLGLFVHTKQDFYEHVLTHIQYLHQLQNFIYLTFNTELNFKP